MNELTPIRSTETNIPTPEQRRLSVEACVLASVVDGPKSHYEIRKFVQSQPGFEWVSIPLVSEIVNRLRRQKRLVLVWREMRTIPSFALPPDPQTAFVRVALDMPKSCKEQAKEASEREMKIIAAIDWPRFFHIPSKEDLLPSTKTRTGYDVRTDYNRF